MDDKILYITRRSLENLTNNVISEWLVLSTGRIKCNNSLSELVGHDRRVFACGVLRRGFVSRLRELVLGVILVPQNNTEYYVQT